jgi:hypothetical protein
MRVLSDCEVLCVEKDSESLGCARDEAREWACGRFSCAAEPSPTGRDAASRLCREGHPHLLLWRGLSRNEAGERGKKSRGTLHPNSDEVNRGRCRAVRSWENQFCAVVTARESWHKRGWLAGVVNPAGAKNICACFLLGAGLNAGTPRVCPSGVFLEVGRHGAFSF